MDSIEEQDYVSQSQSHSEDTFEEFDEELEVTSDLEVTVYEENAEVPCGLCIKDRSCKETMFHV
ncbi:hypothetical protein HOD83_02070 [Candidatus Woesearchaeota archaeon]|jgi:hypothetical protein|nr:hypothetical protein [Candidatus Woesearchaeota archaeon]MBT4114664.1 hypothetical protein [Candidatus Woesearchaeota archaeon]MBT4248352.1 hypothetical protein [Candidatus Woesearchaeota archaeon]